MLRRLRKVGARSTADTRATLPADGATPIATLSGIVVSPDIATRHVNQTMVGGDLPGAGNEIAFVERAGILVGGAVTGVAIRGNSIHDCGALGIDLLGPGSGGAGDRGRNDDSH